LNAEIESSTSHFSFKRQILGGFNWVNLHHPTKEPNTGGLDEDLEDPLAPTRVHHAPLAVAAQVEFENRPFASSLSNFGCKR
jgi:hypothetical protein